MKEYIWRKEWCWPYESAWGILEKFKYANALENNVFKKLLKLRCYCPHEYFSEELFVYKNSIIDDELFYSFFSIPYSHFSYLDVFSGNNPFVIFREDLYYCPKCMELGYHSYWHQINMITRCPFHGDELKMASYNKQTLKYSISTLLTGAFSSMRDTKTIPAERFTQILPSRVLIDGPWDNVCKNINFNEISFERVIFYTPFLDDMQRLKLPQAATYNCMYELFVNESSNTDPVIKISLKECGKQQSNIIEQAKRWYKSREMCYNHYQINAWFTISLIRSLIDPFDSKEINDTILKLLDMRHMQIKREAITDRFVEVASALLTGYHVSNSRDIEDAIDYSLIIHPYTHDIPRCNFSLYKMERFTTPESKIHKYINYLIYLRLFNLLRKHIKQLLTQSQSFDYKELITFNVPDYIITLKNSLYEIYEFYRDD